MTPPSFPARLADAAVAGYQRRLSPRTGSCAHRLAHGGDSCSQAVRGLLERGLVRAVPGSALRFLACYRALALLTPAAQVQGVCCLGGIPVPFRFGRRER